MFHVKHFEKKWGYWRENADICINWWYFVKIWQTDPSADSKSNQDAGGFAKLRVLAFIKNKMGYMGKLGILPLRLKGTKRHEKFYIATKRAQKAHIFYRRELRYRRDSLKVF